MIPIPDSIPPLCVRLIRLAERSPRRAVPLIRRAFEHVEEPLLAAWATYTLGWSLLRWEQLTQAHELLKQTELAFTRLDLAVPALHARYGSLIAALLHGLHTSRQDWQDLALTYEQYGLPLYAARVRIYECGLLNRSGSPQDGLALVEAIRPLIERDGTPEDQGRLLLVIAYALGERGDMLNARAAVEQALVCFQSLKQPLELARGWSERSWLLQLQEKYAPALDDLLRAQAIFIRHEMVMRLAFCDQHIGLLASRLGQYDQAIAATLRARAAFASSGRDDLLANCDLHLGIVAYYCGLYDVALVAYERAQRIYVMQGIHRMARICQRDIALVVRLQGYPEAALEMLERLIAPARAAREDLELAEIVYAQAQVQSDLAQYESALDLFAQAEAMFRDLSNYPAVGKALIDQGWIYVERNQHDLAKTCFEQARPLLLERPAHLWRIDHGLGRCAEQRQQFAQALLHYRHASASVAQMRKIMSEHASSAIFAQAQRLFEDTLRVTALQQNAVALLALAEQQRGLSLLHMLVNPGRTPALDSRLVEDKSVIVRTAELATIDQARLDQILDTYIEVLLRNRHWTPIPESLTPTAFNFERLRSDLNAAYPDDWLTLVYIPCNNELLIVAFDARSIEMFSTPLDKSLRRLLELTTLPNNRPLTYLSPSDGSPAWETLTKLGSLLLPSVLAQRLHPDLRLLIVPAGMLHGVPWAALRFTDRWLIEQAVIQLLPSLTLWPILATRAQPTNGALLLGCSTFGGRARDLPNALPSLDIVERYWRGPTTRLEDEAVSRAVLLQLAEEGALKQLGLIHIATHAQFVAVHGLLAHLQFTSDTLLYDEVTRLHLGGSLIALIACDGAFSEVLPGEEVLSLSRAFLIAGASDVIASLWKVYDRMALVILEPLYAALAEGLDAARSLAVAQRELIGLGRSSDGNESMLPPLVWGNFCVIGGGRSGLR